MRPHGRKKRAKHAHGISQIRKPGVGAGDEWRYRRNMSRLSMFARFVLVFVLGVILLGAYVRASGSGAGCGTHWPTCNGDLVPHQPGSKTIIEYSHRLTSGVSMLLVFALYGWSIGARDASRRYAGWASLFMITEAALGAGIVLLRYVEDNASWARAAWTAMHLGNTFLLLAALALACIRVGGVDAKLSLRRADFVGLLLLLAVASVGAVTALGDTIFPSATLQEGLRADLQSTHFLVRLRVIHPLIAVAVALYWWMQTATEAATWTRAIRMVLAAQIAVGAVSIATLAPIVLQLVHLLLADALWLAAVVFSDERRRA